MATQQKFGGQWTEEKLEMFTGYLNAYLKALKNTKFKKIYIDAFAGTGEIETMDGEQCLPGSARRALEAEKKFDYYFFIERDREKAQELRNMIETDFRDSINQVQVLCGDANEELIKILDKINWKYSRGLLFLDPYATQVNWSTLTEIAKTESVDVWYLFPIAALNRMLSKDRITCVNCIDRLLGDSGWQEEFYKKDPQLSIFDFIDNSDETNNESRVIRDADITHIQEYIIKRLKTVFPCVAEKPRIFRNSKNSPLFLFCFAISNRSQAAQSLALRIANHILKG